MVITTPRGTIALDELFSAVRYQEINGEHYIDIETTQKLERGDFVTVISDVDGTRREYIVWSATEPHDADLIARKYRCVWSLQALLSASTSTAMPGTSGQAATATEALTELLREQVAYEVGTVEPTTTGSASFWRMSAWEGLSRLTDVWGGEVQARFEGGHRFVDLLNHMGSEQPIFTYYYGGPEVESVTVNVADGPKVCRVFPLGAAEQTDSWGYGRKITIEDANGGVPWLQDDLVAQEMANTPNPTATLYIENEDCNTPQQLKAWALSVLHDYTRPEPEYVVKTVERFVQDGEKVPLLGDEGYIIDIEMGLTLASRVWAIKVDELAKTISTTISNKRIAPGSFAVLLGKKEKPQYQVTWRMAKQHTWKEMLLWGK